MADRRVHLTAPPSAHSDALPQAFAAIRERLEVPIDFPAEVTAEAERATAAGPMLPPTADATQVPFVTIDPPGSMDLDQAMHLERSGSGFRVRYAIADVPAFVRAGGAIDAEARRRGETIYLPDGSEPLHPRQLSEGAASLLPGQVRPAFVWDMTLDSDGVVRDAAVGRAMVRSATRLDYQEVQADLDAGRAPQMLALLAEVGGLRIAVERERGGASLPKPEQEVVTTKAGYELRFRPPVPVEDWNAQISLMTGMVAAQMMLEGGIGILRTMPAPDAGSVDRFRRQAEALGVPWPQDMPYGEFLRKLHRADPHHLALMHAATSLFRGAGYTPFDGTVPQQRDHAAVAAPYAHVTAPLRRLVDRFALAVCGALSSGDEVPDWAREALPSLPDIMKASGRLSGAVERACTDAVEAAVLAPLVGHEWPATVVEARGERGCTVQIVDPAVLAECAEQVESGRRVRVRLIDTDVAAQRSRFTIVETLPAARREGAGGRPDVGDGDGHP